MALTYLPNAQPQAGQLAPATDPSDGSTKQVVIPAVTMVSATGAQSPSGTATDPSYTQSGALPAGTDRSGTTSATANTSTQLAAANSARRGLNIQNISANPMGVNEFGGAASIGTAGTYTVAAGGTINVRTNRQINVVSGTASQPYTATEF